MENVIVVLVIAILLLFGILYIVNEKRKGRACIGCPSSGSCSKCKGCGSENHVSGQ